MVFGEYSSADNTGSHHLSLDLGVGTSSLAPVEMTGGVWGEELQWVESRHGITGTETAWPGLQCGSAWHSEEFSVCGLVSQNPSPTCVFGHTLFAFTALQ